MKYFHNTLSYKTFLVGIALFLTSTVINAMAITFTDSFNPAPDPLIAFGNNQSYSFTHSIIDDQDGANAKWNGIYGYNPLTDNISSTSITLTFRDENTDTAPESVQLIFDDQSFGTRTITSGGATYTATISNGLNALLTEGILNVTLENAGLTSGQQEFRSDFLFLESTLTVAVNRREESLSLVQAPQAIPEPPTLLLLCSVLSLLTFNRRAGNSEIAKNS